MEAFYFYSEKFEHVSTVLINSYIILSGITYLISRILDIEITLKLIMTLTGWLFMSLYGIVLSYIGSITFIYPSIGPRDYFAILPMLIGGPLVVFGGIRRFYHEIRKAMFEQQERNRRSLDT
jgi:hypothetical protein